MKRENMQDCIFFWFVIRVKFFDRINVNEVFYSGVA